MEQKTPVRSYLAVIGASTALFTSVGFLNAFGVFQEYYKAYQLRDKTASEISWIGSVGMFMLYLLAPVAGVLVDKVGPRILLCGGAIGEVLAIFMISLCSQYYQFFLAQALLIGISMAFVTWPPMGTVMRHLPNNRGLALGLVVGGSSIGGIVWPVVLEQLLNHTSLGFGWTMRIVGFIMIPFLLVGCVFVTEAPAPPGATVPASPTEAPAVPSSGSDEELQRREKPGHTADLSLLRNRMFLLLCLGLAIGYLGLFTPFFYVSSYATEEHVSSSMSFYVVSFLNGASFCGRIIPGILADRWGHYNFMVAALATSAVLAFCWTAAMGLAGIIVWSLAYGFTSGAVLSLQGACAGKIATRETQGTAMGLLTGSIAVTVLVGTPIAGQLVIAGGYLALSMFTGATLIAGAVIVSLARLALDQRFLAAV